MLQVAVRRDEDIEVAFRFCQELAVAQLRPSELESGADFVVAQMLAQRPRNPLIEENAH